MRASNPGSTWQKLSNVGLIVGVNDISIWPAISSFSPNNLVSTNIKKYLELDINQIKCLDSNSKMHLIKLYGLKLKQFYLVIIMGILMQFLVNQKGKLRSNSLLKWKKYHFKGNSKFVHERFPNPWAHSNHSFPTGSRSECQGHWCFLQVHCPFESHGAGCFAADFPVHLASHTAAQPCIDSAVCYSACEALTKH